MSAETATPCPVVLLVEDEVKLLEITSIRLAELGCEVLEADGPLPALALFRDHAGRIDFVFTDLRMQGMGGFGLIEELIKIDPEVRIVAASALIDELDAVRARWGDRIRLILKPYDTEELQVLLRLECR